METLIYWPTIAKIPEVYPACTRQLVNTQDFQHLLLLCQRRGQKPEPFVPVLDENFQNSFNKDSLWQSEDLDAVVDQDVGRTCILQGPVAAKYSKIVDEPVKRILDNIHEGHIANLEKELYSGVAQIPVLGYFGGKDLGDGKDGHLDGVVTSLGHDTIKHQISSGPDGTLPGPDDWFRILARNAHSWRHAFFTVDFVFQGNRIMESPFKRLFAPAPNVEVEMTYPNDPKRTTVILREHSCSVIEVRMSSDDEIVLTIFERRVLTGESVGLRLLFSYRSEAGYCPSREVMEDRNERIRAFYYELQFGSQGDKTALDGALTDTFEGDTFTVDRQAVADFVNAIGNNSEAYVVRNGNADKTYAPMDYAFKVAWKAMTKPLFLKAMDGDLSKLVHLSSGFRMRPGVTPLKLGDVLESTSRVEAILVQDSGKIVEVTGTIKREGIPTMEVKAQYLYRGSYSDYENTFQRKHEVPMNLHLQSAKDVIRLTSRSWFHPRDPNIDLLHKVLTFRLESVIRFKSKATFSHIETTGAAQFQSSTGENQEVATVEYSAGRSRGNPVIDYLEHHGSPTEKPHMFDNAILLSGQIPLSIEAPASNQLYAQVSSDHNPIHVSRIFAKYVALKGNITHGMYISAAVRGLVEKWAADNDVERVRRFDCSFVGMVLPNDRIGVRLWHVGMIAGRKIVKVEATVGSEKVLLGDAEVEEPVSAYLFTGQGSQHQGMGMELYAQNQIAREVWDRADAHMMDVFGPLIYPCHTHRTNAVSDTFTGFSILKIVRENPKELTIHFGGPRGRAIRDKYISITVETSGANGEVSLQRIFKDVDENTESYTHRAPNGLLYSTQFAQPALTLMAKASFAALRAKSLIPDGSIFAGHSLGEYAALSAFSECMRIEDLITLVFYRCLTMQLSVERDEAGRTNYAMCALNPSRVSPSTSFLLGISIRMQVLTIQAGFDEQSLCHVVQTIQDETRWLLEMVNLNIENQQYTCTGDVKASACNVFSSSIPLTPPQLRALDTLISVTNHLYKSPSSPIVPLIRTSAATTASKRQPINLARGVAAVPLHGIDVPFHSTFLRSGVRPFRSLLSQFIKRENVDPKQLVGKYIPNLTGMPFEISRAYLEEVGRLTGSEEIDRILGSVSSRLSREECHVYLSIKLTPLVNFSGTRRPQRRIQ